METFIAALKKHKTNDELLAKMSVGADLETKPEKRFIPVRRWSGCCASIRPFNPAVTPTPSRSPRELEVSTKSIHRDIEFMRDRLELPLNTTRATTAIITPGSQRVSHPANHRGRIVRAARRGKGVATISRHDLRETALSAFKKMASRAARHRFAEPGRLGADHFLPHQRRADS
jgi:hypothetical protein